MSVAEQSYVRLADQDRSYIRKRLDAHESIRKIAGTLKFSASSISREIGRNGGPKRYCPVQASRRRPSAFCAAWCARRRSG